MFHVLSKMWTLKKNLFVHLLAILSFNTFESLAFNGVTITVPFAAKTHDIITLQCKFDLLAEPLYTIKWYKGSKEFFRFIPKEMPSTSAFPLPGVNVDKNKSHSSTSFSEVVLRDVQPETSGRYKCEVSTDFPNFYAHSQSSYLYVIDVPTEDPELIIDNNSGIEPGDIIRGNCSSPPSYPPVNITWQLNGNKINASFVTTFNDNSIMSQQPSAALSRRQQLVTIAGLEIEAKSSYFQKGKVHIECIATIFNLYRRVQQVVLDHEDSNPISSSVLGSRNTSSESILQKAPTLINISILILFFSLR